MEGIQDIIGETIPYGPIEMAQDLQVKSGSSNASGINWTAIIIVGVVGIALAIVISEMEKKQRKAAAPQSN